jgi:hypothetical protein
LDDGAVARRGFSLPSLYRRAAAGARWAFAPCLRAAEPEQIQVTVEVSDATLGYDRLEVHRQPAPMADQPRGHHFRGVTRHTETEAFAPRAAPNTPVVAADPLP